MINLLVNLDLGSPEVVRERTVEVGEIFPIVIHAESGNGEVVEFDNLVIEVFFNDSSDVIVRVDPTDRPVAGTLVAESDSAVDAFRPQQDVQCSKRLTPESVTESTPLSLFGFASVEPAGPFRGRSGRAGIASTAKPFRLKSGASPSVAAGKATAGLEAARSGETRIIANGLAFLNGENIPIRSIPSTLTVKASGKQGAASAY